MVSSRTRTTALMLLCLLFAGCLEHPADTPEVPGASAPVHAQDAPPEAGVWNGTAVKMRVDDIGPAVVRYVRLTSPVQQHCESAYRTEGNISEPWGFGWSIGTFSRSFGVLPVIGNNTRSFSHAFIAEGTVNGEVAGSDAPGSIGGGFPRPVYGNSTSTITVGEGQEMTYLLATSYATSGANDAGRMTFEVTCPAGMSALETGWSTVAHLLSDVAMDGTWASVHADAVNARWGATPQVEWTARLPEAPTTFIATAPVAGKAELTSPSGRHVCGPSQDFEQAAKGDALCLHEYDGGETRLEISQSAIGNVGQLHTSDSWMGLIAQMRHHTWAVTG